jgi:hypothetical protein
MGFAGKVLIFLDRLRAGADRGEAGRARLIYQESIWQNPAAYVPALAATAKKKRIAIRIDQC